MVADQKWVGASGRVLLDKSQKQIEEGGGIVGTQLKGGWMRVVKDYRTWLMNEWRRVVRHRLT